VEEGKFKVIVKQSYFKGSHYLIKAAFERKAVFFEHHSELDSNQEVSLLPIKASSKPHILSI
jgi:hypothetical protein